METDEQGERPVLPCPECSTVHGEERLNRIGNRTRKCRTCNRFAQAVRRHVARALQAAHPQEADSLRLAAEREVYTSLGLALPDSLRPESLNGAGTPEEWADPAGLPLGDLPVGSTDSREGRTL